MERKEKYGFGMWKDIPLALVRPVYIVVADELDVISFCKTKEEAFAVLDVPEYYFPGPVSEFTIYEVKLIKKVRFQNGNMVDNKGVAGGKIMEVRKIEFERRDDVVGVIVGIIIDLDAPICYTISPFMRNFVKGASPEDNQKLNGEKKFNTLHLEVIVDDEKKADEVFLKLKTVLDELEFKEVEAVQKII